MCTDMYLGMESGVTSAQSGTDPEWTISRPDLLLEAAGTHSFIGGIITNDLFPMCSDAGKKAEVVVKIKVTRKHLWLLRD